MQTHLASTTRVAKMMLQLLCSSASEGQGGVRCAGDPSSAEFTRECLQTMCLLLLDGNLPMQNAILHELVEGEDETLCIKFFRTMKNLVDHKCVLPEIRHFRWLASAREQLALCGDDEAKEAETEAQLLQLAGLECNFLPELMRFFQLLCEGHHSGMQRALREQPTRSTQVNLVTTVVSCLVRVQRNMVEFNHEEALSKSNVEAVFTVLHELLCITHQVLCTLIELTEGPCFVNQEDLLASPFVVTTAGA